MHNLARNSIKSPGTHSQSIARPKHHVAIWIGPPLTNFLDANVASPQRPPSTAQSPKQASQIRQQQAQARLHAVRRHHSKPRRSGSSMHTPSCVKPPILKCMPLRCLEALCCACWAIGLLASGVQVTRRTYIRQSGTELTRPPGSHGRPSGLAAEAAAGNRPVRKCSMSEGHLK